MGHEAAANLSPSFHRPWHCRISFPANCGDYFSDGVAMCKMETGNVESLAMVGQSQGVSETCASSRTKSQIDELWKKSWLCTT